MPSLPIRPSRSFLAVAALTCFAVPVAAQETPDQEVTRVEDVVVEGTTLRRQVQVFVAAVTEPPRGHGPARWRETSGVCVGVFNLRRETAQAIADRVSEIAADLGLRVGEPGCDANVLIVATDDPAALAAGLVERSPAAFRPGWSGASRSRQALAAFTQGDRPIRWWHLSLPMIRDTNSPAVRMPGNPNAPYIPGGTRLRTSVENVLLRAYVIIDFDQVETLSLRQLADYAAFVAFAQIDPEAETGGFPTILNALADPGSVAEMTTWDRDYLAGLYGSELHQRQPGSQLSDVSGIMFRRQDRAARAAETSD